MSENTWEEDWNGAVLTFTQYSKVRGVGPELYDVRVKLQDGRELSPQGLVYATVEEARAAALALISRARGP